MKSIKLWLLLLLGFVATTIFAQKPTVSPTLQSGEEVEILLEEVEDPNIAVEGNPADSPKSSLLWEISGNGLEESSYLFGTIHMIAKEEYFWTDIMDEKFNTTEKLVLEIDMKNPMMMMFSMLGSLMMEKGTTLKTLLTEEEYKMVEDYLMKEKGMSLAMFDRIKPIFTSMIMGEMGQDVSYEMELIEKAKVRKMKTGGLETAEYQISIFDSIPYEAQAQMLVESIKGSDGAEAETAMKEMVELYKQQDLDGLYQLIVQDESGVGDFEDVFLITRNKNWIPKIKKMAKDKPTFFAVGAGHLPGKQGVINLLKAEGYTLTPIR